MSTPRDISDEIYATSLAVKELRDEKRALLPTLVSEELFDALLDIAKIDQVISLLESARSILIEL